MTPLHITTTRRRYKKNVTIKNKIYALLLIVIGLLPILIDHDGTAFVIILMIAGPLFFARENWIC